MYVSRKPPALALPAPAPAPLAPPSSGPAARRADSTFDAPRATASSTGRPAVIRADPSANVRAGPGISRARIGGFADGTKVTVVEPQPPGGAAGWSYVRGIGLDGRPLEGWVADGWNGIDLVRAPGSTGGAGAPPRQSPARPGSFVNGNYTDLGMQSGVFSEQAAAEDLDRLRAAGLTNVRIWAAPPSDVQGMSNRVAALLRLAAQRGMTLTIDLIDGHNNTQLASYEGPFTAELRRRIQTIVAQNAGARNAIWSLGNELQAPDRPREFASWYSGLVGELRRAGARTVACELVPGACGNDLSNPDVRRAMQTLAQAVDVVSIHMYPDVAAAGVEGSSFGGEWAVFMEWRRLARSQGKPLYVGELALRPPVRDAANLDAWLRELQGAGVATVMLWQFMKDEGGHYDDLSYDSVDGPSFQRELTERGWLR